MKFLERQIFLFLKRGGGLASSAIPSQSLAKHDSRSEFGHKSNSNHMLSKLKCVLCLCGKINIQTIYMIIGRYIKTDFERFAISGLPWARRGVENMEEETRLLVILTTNL